MISVEHLTTAIVIIKERIEYELASTAVIDLDHPMRRALQALEEEREVARLRESTNIELVARMMAIGQELGREDLVWGLGAFESPGEMAKEIWALATALADRLQPGEQQELFSEEALHETRIFST